MLNRAITLSRPHVRHASPWRMYTSLPPTLVQRVKAFFKQYYNGIKTLKSNVPEYRRLQQLPAASLTRAETRMVQQTRRDLAILVPFCVILFVLPEAIPLFVLKNWVPSTCLSSEDVIKARAKRFDQRRKVAKVLYAQLQQSKLVQPHDHLSTASIVAIVQRNPRAFDLNTINARQLRFCCKFFGVQRWGTKTMLAGRLNHFLIHIREDDLKIDDIGVDSLTSEELAGASEDRGIFTEPLHPSREQLSVLLNTWIKLNTIHSADNQTSVDPTSSTDKTTVPMTLLLFSRIVQFEHLAQALETKALPR